MLRPADFAVAAAFVAFALTEEFVVRMPGGWWPFALALFAGLVLLRRVVPLVAIAANGVSALAVLHDEVRVSYRLWQLVAMIIAAYTAGRLLRWTGDRRERARAVPAAALVVATAVIYWTNDRTDPMAAFFFSCAPYALGVAMAVQTERLAETAAVRASIREQRAREAVMEERVRIARELHDMVAHSVTVMTIQAGVVRRRLEAGLPVDPQLLRTVESSGRDAVGELRRTLGLLRGEGAAQAPVGLERLDELIVQVREAGLTVHVTGTSAGPLPPAVDLSAYRIIQEALTNVLKHAGPARVEVTVDRRPDGLHLAVIDDGRPATASGGGAGQGLIGMRERVMLFGGELTAGPRPEGGFAVRAWLPVGRAPSAATGPGSAEPGPAATGPGSALPGPPTTGPGSAAPGPAPSEPSPTEASPTEAGSGGPGARRAVP